MIDSMEEYLRGIGKQPKKGQTLLEFSLIIALIALAAVVALQLIGPQIAAIYNQIAY